jgi:hypothetical protein
MRSRNRDRVTVGTVEGLDSVPHGPSSPDTKTPNAVGPVTRASTGAHRSPSDGRPKYERLISGGPNPDPMEIVDSFDAGAGADGTVLGYDGLLGEVLLVGIIVTVYLIGVATNRNGRKI